jgi:hypothetical protein
MPAATLNISIEQGATFRMSMVYETDVGGVMTPVNLTGYSARMQVRRAANSPTISLDLSSTAGDITLDAVGNVVVEATPTQTAAIDIRSGVYDLELEAADGRVTRLLQGKVTVSPEVTR